MAHIHSKVWHRRKYPKSRGYFVPSIHKFTTRLGNPIHRWSPLYPRAQGIYITHLLLSWIVKLRSESSFEYWFSENDSYVSWTLVARLNWNKAVDRNFDPFDLIWSVSKLYGVQWGCSNKRIQWRTYIQKCDIAESTPNREAILYLVYRNSRPG